MKEKGKQTERDTFILRSLTKNIKKPWEYFVISRIIHSIHDSDIEFKTQQLVKRSDGSRALTDIYFPQFRIHLEVDERHHFINPESDGLEAPKRIEADVLRERDIVQQTGHSIRRIKTINPITGADKSLREIANEVDLFVEELHQQRDKQKKLGEFIPWNFDTRYDVTHIMNKGKISITDNIAFRKQIDAMRCFGFQGKGWMKGVWKIPDDSGRWLWFPRLYRHGMWLNELSADGTIINENAITEEGLKSLKVQRAKYSGDPDRKLVVFSKAKDVLGTQLLRYVGTFKANLSEEHFNEDSLRFDRIQTHENTIPC